MDATRELVEVGGLMAYGSNVPDLDRRTPTYGDTILEGARPGTAYLRLGRHRDAKQAATASVPWVIAGSPAP